MKKTLVLFSLLVSLFLLSAVFGAAPAKPAAGHKATSSSFVKKRPPAKRTVYPKPALAKKIAPSKGAVPAKEWTILYYLDADNNLEPDMFDDVNEIEQIGSTESVNLVTLFDRLSQNGQIPSNVRIDDGRPD